MAQKIGALGRAEAVRADEETMETISVHHERRVDGAMVLVPCDIQSRIEKTPWLRPRIAIGRLGIKQLLRPLRVRLEGQHPAAMPSDHVARRGEIRTGDRAVRGKRDEIAGEAAPDRPVAGNIPIPTFVSSVEEVVSVAPPVDRRIAQIVREVQHGIGDVFRGDHGKGSLWDQTSMGR